MIRDSGCPHTYYTGAVHPNDVAAPEIANAAWIVLAAAHIPKQAVAKLAKPSIRLNTLKCHRPLKSPCNLRKRIEHRKFQADAFTLFQRDHSLQVSICPWLPLPGLYALSSIMASIRTWYPNQRRGGNVYVNCMIAAAAMIPEIVWTWGMEEPTINAGKSLLTIIRVGK